MRNELEQLVSDIGRKWEAAGLARIWKVPEALSQTPCDFFGYRRDGVAVMIECKIRNKPSLSIGGEGDLPGHQFIALRDAGRCEVRAALVWQNGDEFTILDPEMIGEMATGRKSVPWKNIRYRWPVNDFAAAYQVFTTRIVR